MGIFKLVLVSMAQVIVAALVATLASVAQAGAGGLRSEPDGEVAEPSNTTENATFTAALEAAILGFEEHIEDNVTLSAEVGICGAMSQAIGAYGGKGKKDK